MLGAVDESQRRRKLYVVALVTYPTSAEGAVRRRVSSHLLLNQSHWHTNSEGDSRRRRFVDDMINCGLFRVLLYCAAANPVQARQVILPELIMDATKLGVTRLVLDQGESSQDARDRRTIRQALQSTDADLVYQYRKSRAEPGVQVADAFAWCWGAGGQWRQRIAPAVEIERELLA